MRRVSRRLVERFEEIREVQSDAGLKGGENELTLRDFLVEHCARGEVRTKVQLIDATGAQSSEVDVCACNADQPFRGVRVPLILAEGVDFVVEVKARLDERELDRAFLTCASVKSLRRSFDQGDQASIKRADTPYMFYRIPFIVFAYESRMSLYNVTRRCQARFFNEPSELQPDAIFILNRGAVLNFKSGEGSTFYLPDGSHLVGPCGFPRREDTLLEMVRYIHAEIPRIVRSASPLQHYLNAAGKGLEGAIVAPPKTPPPSSAGRARRTRSKRKK